jgi:hypothetical protein
MRSSRLKRFRSSEWCILNRLTATSLLLLCRGLPAAADAPSLLLLPLLLRVA